MPRWSFDLVTRSGPRVITPRYGKEPSESVVRGGADQISLKADRRSAPLVRQGRDYRINFLDCRLSAVYVRDMFYSGPRERCVSVRDRVRVSRMSDMDQKPLESGRNDDF